MDPAVILYDGECGMCDRFVSFVIRRDRQGFFRYAPLQGAWAGQRLADAGGLLGLKTVVVATPGGELLVRSAAVLYVLRRLGRAWSWLARIGGWLPRAFGDRAYEAVARHRYRLFGRLEACRLPSPQQRHLFL